MVPLSRPLPTLARVHVGKWGDRGAYVHVFFIARPARIPQFKGTMMAVWDDLLPPIPGDVRDANARAVIQHLVGASDALPAALRDLCDRASSVAG